MPTSYARGQIDLINEQWKANHLEAMACCDFEDFLRFCIETFERIARQDENWRRSVLRGTHDFSPEVEEEFRELYSDWERVCSKLLVPLAAIERREYHLDSADAFRACIREAKGALICDDVFFDSDALADLRDQAIDENRRDEVDHVGGQG